MADNLKIFLNFFSQQCGSIGWVRAQKCLQIVPKQCFCKCFFFHYLMEFSTNSLTDAFSQLYTVPTKVLHLIGKCL